MSELPTDTLAQVIEVVAGLEVVDLDGTAALKIDVSHVRGDFTKVGDALLRLGLVQRSAA